MKRIVKQCISIILNVLMAFFVIKAFLPGVTQTIKDLKSGSMSLLSENDFTYFTSLSNFFICFISILIIPFKVVSLFKKDYEVPTTIIKIKHVAVVAISITFTVVLFLFVPFIGFKAAYENRKIFSHLTVPIMAVIEYLFFEEYREGKVIHFLSMIPVAAYAIFIYFPLVYIFKLAPDFYQFAILGATSVVIISIALLGLSFLYSFVYNKAKSKLSKIL